MRYNSGRRFKLSMPDAFNPPHSKHIPRQVLYRFEIRPAPGHILAAGEITVLDDDRLQAVLCEELCAGKAGEAGPYYDGIHFVHYFRYLPVLSSVLPLRWEAQRKDHR
jgi:hypothetical protein